jgi:hypothetical protein
VTIHHYQDFNFKQDSLDLIDQLNDVIQDWQSQGYTLTVRQLYYQMVARAIIENTEQSYKRITGIVNNARLAGLMRWDAIEDRTREFITRSHWSSPQSIMRGAANSYHMDMWEDQATRVFVIVEKEALTGILEKTCNKYDVPLLAARGYPSGTVLREFAVKMVMPALENNQSVTILHLGDHDPSGIDMTRDLEERIRLFSECDMFGTDISLYRIALTKDQIDDQRPPPNPAKSTDSRFNDYRKKYGNSSWELDALSPTYLNDLVENYIDMDIDSERWEKRETLIETARAEITRVSKLVKFEMPD